MDSKLVIGVHLCDKSDLYMIRQLEKYEGNRNEVRYDAVKLLDLSNFTVCDLSIEECHKLGYEFFSFSYGCRTNTSDKYIFGNIGTILDNSLFGSSKIGDLYECSMPIYYKGELAYENNDRILRVGLNCCNSLRAGVKFGVNILVDLIDYRVQCKTANGFNIYGDFDLMEEHIRNEHYRYESGVIIENSRLFPSLCDNINKGICIFNNRLAVLSLEGEGSYIIPSGVESACIFGFGDKSNIVIPISLNEVYLSGDTRVSDIKFLLSSSASNAFLKRLYKSIVNGKTGINTLFDRESILEAFKTLDGIELEFY